jgi:arylsulfatase A-like enzyme
MTDLIIIDCHDLGRHLGCYGHATLTSPALDRLAGDGMRFANSFCTAPQCSPSRATLYTGRYAHANGMFGLAHDPFNWRLHDDEIYLPRYFQRAGYETALIGGQHVTASDREATQRLGFDHVSLSRDAAQITAEAAAFIRGPHARPYYLHIGFYETHRDETGGFTHTPPDMQKGIAVPPYLPNTPEAQQEFAAFQGAVRRLDAAVGAIAAALDDADRFRDTWLIFTTDHGIAMPRAKCTMYDPGIETALIMRAPPFGLVGGRVIDALISHVDLVPTVLEAFGLPIPAGLHGRSYWALLQGRPYTARTHLFAEKTYHTAYEPQRALRTERYKLIVNLEVDIINVPADIQHSPIYPQMIPELTQERPPVELYDLAADPLEKHNLADQPDLTAIRQELLGTLYAWMRDTGDPILNGPIPSPYYHRAIDLLRGAAAS